jgi:hypothetical protein
MPRYRGSRRRPLGALPLRASWIVLLAAIALALAACPEEAPIVEETPDALPEPAERVALDERCANEEWGYEIGYPSGWVTNDDNLLPACSAFDPEEVVIDLGAEIAIDAAIHLQLSPQRYETLIAETPGRDEVSREDVVVDGHTATILHWRATAGAPMFPSGTHVYAYFIELDRGTLVATTTDLAGQEKFDEHRSVLDTMMAEIDLEEVVDEPADEQPDEDEG